MKELSLVGRPKFYESIICVYNSRLCFIFTDSKNLLDVEMGICCCTSFPSQLLSYKQLLLSINVILKPCTTGKMEICQKH